jgi:hypothetical protein
MDASPNDLRWQGRPGHYEVHYLTATDPATGLGLWIRYTLLAPRNPGTSATASLWFLAMDPRPGAARPVHARKRIVPIGQLRATRRPFALRIGDAVLSNDGMSGAVDDAAWDLRWTPGRAAPPHVRPALRRARVAQTVLTLPHPDLRVSGTVKIAGEPFTLSGVPGGQAHLWGSKHARGWAWVHCNDLETDAGLAVPGSYIDGVSVFVARGGRTVGPSTPVVGRFDGADFASTAPLAVLRNRSAFETTTWRFEATDGPRRVRGEVYADPALLAGVTYEDPDGEFAYCYNSETASLRLDVLHRTRPLGHWAHQQTLRAEGVGHFEYAQRTPLAEPELALR